MPVFVAATVKLQKVISEANFSSSEQSSDR